MSQEEEVVSLNEEEIVEESTEEAVSEEVTEEAEAVQEIAATDESSESEEE